MIVLTSNKIKSICDKWFNIVVTDSQINDINNFIEKYMDLIGDDVIYESDLAEIIGDVIL